MINQIQSKTKFWWAYLVLGILVLIAGGNFLAKPAVTIVTISLFVSLFLIVSGAYMAIMSIVDRKIISLWGLHLVLNILVLLAGIWMIVNPAFAASFLWLFAGLGFLFQGIAAICISIAIKKMKESSWVLLLILGIISVIASLFIFGDALFAFDLIWIFVSIDVVILGIELIVLSFQLKPNK